MINLDQLTQSTVLGYIFGGLISNGPHTRSGDPPATSSASNIIFTVLYTPVPEPSSSILALIAFISVAGLPQKARRRALERHD